MIDVEGWDQIESDEADVFGRYEHDATDTTISICRGENWPDTVVVNLNGEVISQNELTPDALDVARERMRQIQSRDVGSGRGVSSERSVCGVGSVADEDVSNER